MSSGTAIGPSPFPTNLTEPLLATPITHPSLSHKRPPPLNLPSEFFLIPHHPEPPTTPPPPPPLEFFYIPRHVPPPQQGRSRSGTTYTAISTRPAEEDQTSLHTTCNKVKRAAYYLIMLCAMGFLGGCIYLMSKNSDNSSSGS